MLWNVDLFSYFRGPFFLHPVNGHCFLVDVISVDFFFPNTELAITVRDVIDTVRFETRDNS